MFEKAARLKLRFPYKGHITVEDLWDLSVEDLDAIYTSINHSLKAFKDEGLMVKKDSNVAVMELRLEILKHIYEVKVQEAKAKLAEKERRERKRRIEELIAKKQDSELEGKSLEELAAMRDALEEVV
jgi:hypothetical protein